jgi:hypothetical protein
MVFHHATAYREYKLLFLIAMDGDGIDETSTTAAKEGSPLQRRLEPAAQNARFINLSSS